MPETSATATRRTLPPQHWLRGALRAVRSPLADADLGPDVATAWRRAVAEGVASEALLKASAATLHVPRADWGALDTSSQRLLSAAVARPLGVFPLRHSDRELVVAAVDPADMALEQKIGFASGRRVLFELATADEIDAAWRAGFEDLGARMAEVARAVRNDDPAEASDDPFVGVLRDATDEAVALGASDLHVEPTVDGGVIRVRIDGLLQPFARVDKTLFPRVIGRIKVNASLDVAEHRRPQDGRASRKVRGRDVEFRVSILPTKDGEKAVIRILNASGPPSLHDLGLLHPEHEQIAKLLKNRTGIVVITGPTGSGKTTTLFAALASLDAATLNISTIEDPIEYHLPGITQTQVQLATGLTFATALRSLLRQDPNVILVGELRDAEAAEVAVQAAGTGHLVLTSLHTNDAASAIARLQSLGVEGHALTDTIRGIVAQRLVRRLCNACAVPADAAAAAVSGMRNVRRAVGCPQCRTTGYKGRVAVAEALVATPAVVAAITAGADPSKIREVASSEGMRTMSEVARQLVADGVTTAEEVLRVLDMPA